MLGIEARVRAFASEGERADSLYRQSIEQLDGPGLRIEHARGHLFYGEWLRREHRRLDARVQLRAAHDMLDDTRLFISPRTVEYHLHKVFAKLDISSRNQLHRALGPGTGDRD